MTKTRYPEPTLDQVMYPSAWALLARLASRYTQMTARNRASREASTLYALGLCTDPDGADWAITPAGIEARLARRS